MPERRDNWIGRGQHMRCRTCMWFVRKQGSKLGRYRKNAPGPGGWVPVFDTDWCGQHRLDEATSPLSTLPEEQGGTADAVSGHELPEGGCGTGLNTCDCDRRPVIRGSVGF